MKTGINAADHRWHGSLVKKDFLHTPEQHDKLTRAVSIRYRGISLESASKDYYWSEHLHTYPEILFVRRGTYACELNGCSLSMRTGSILIVEPGDRHLDICRPPLEYYAVWFDITQAADRQQIHILKNNTDMEERIHIPSDRSVFKGIEALFREEQRATRFSFSLQQAMAEELVWRILGDLPEDILNPLLVKQTNESELLMRLTRIFEQNVHQPMTIGDMAGHMNMSESALAHKCTDILGISPARAFAMFRIAKAAHMLRHSTLSIKEIASTHGFHDESHFIHSFRREYGMTPGKFRSSNGV